MLTSGFSEIGFYPISEKLMLKKCSIIPKLSSVMDSQNIQITPFVSVKDRRKMFEKIAHTSDVKPKQSFEIKRNTPEVAVIPPSYPETVIIEPVSGDIITNDKPAVIPPPLPPRPFLRRTAKFYRNSSATDLPESSIRPETSAPPMTNSDTSSSVTKEVSYIDPEKATKEQKESCENISTNCTAIGTGCCTGCLIILQIIALL